MYSWINVCVLCMCICLRVCPSRSFRIDAYMFDDSGQWTCNKTIDHTTYDLYIERQGIWERSCRCVSSLHIPSATPLPPIALHLLLLLLLLIGLCSVLLFLFLLLQFTCPPFPFFSFLNFPPSLPRVLLAPPLPSFPSFFLLFLLLFSFFLLFVILA